MQFMLHGVAMIADMLPWQYWMHSSTFSNTEQAESNVKTVTANFSQPHPSRIVQGCGQNIFFTFFGQAY